MSDPANKPPVTIDVGLKAEAKMGLKAEIPSSSMGRLVDAITDTFRPFSEARGLRGDQIRLQRVEVAIKVAELAKKQLEADQVEIIAVAPKVLIPLIEKSSLEDPNSEMVQRWANLLSKAATSGGIHPRLVQILSELEGKQVELLERISLNSFEKWNFPLTRLYDSAVELGSIHTDDHIYAVTARKGTTPDKILDDFQRRFDRPGSMFLASLIYSELIEGLENSVPHVNDLELHIEICESLGLMRLVRTPLSFQLDVEVNGEIQSFYHGGFLSFCHLTAFGIKLVEACAPDEIKKLKDAQSKRNGADPDYDEH